MRARTALVASLVVVAAAGSLSPAVAKAKPKPITKTYTATAPTPDPTPVTGQTGGNCHPTLPTAMDERAFKVPYPGILTVDITGFQGDWAGALLDSDGFTITDNDQGTTDPIDTPVHLSAAFKKKGEVVTIRACNFSGGPTATVKYVFKAK